MLKKKTSLFIALCLATISLMAQDLVIPKLIGAPVIDGVVDPVWDEIDAVNCEFEPTDDFGDASIFEGWFKMAWNDTAFFMLMYRDDDDFADQWETTLADWQSDRDEIFFDVHVDTLADGRGASDSQQGSSYGHYQFTSIWVQNATEWIGMPQQWYHNAPFYFGYVRTGDSYYTEYAWPFTSLTIDQAVLPGTDETFQAEAGVIFGLQVAIGDVDMYDNPTDETFRKWIKWVDEGGWDDMDDAGHVELGSEEITVPSLTESFLAENISVFPSPSGDFIQINGITKSSNIRIYNVTGGLVLSQDNVNSGTRINLVDLTQGVYFIRIVDGITLKFMKN